MFSTRNVTICVVLAGAAVAGVLTAPGQNQPLRPDSEGNRQEETVARFFDRVSFGEIDEAFGELLVGSAIQEQADARRQLVEKTAALEAKFGPFRSSEQLSQRQIGDDLVLLTYLYKCERYPVVWRFIYYRPSANERWKLITVRFDSDLESIDL